MSVSEGTPRIDKTVSPDGSTSRSQSENLHLSMGVGPDYFGGQAHVDFWFFGFNIDVGDVKLGNPPISLADFFFELIRSTGQPGEFRSTGAISSSMENRAIALHKWTVERDLAPVTTSDAVPGQPFPCTSSGKEWDVNASFYSTPMHILTGATSSLEITVEHDCTRPGRFGSR